MDREISREFRYLLNPLHSEVLWDDHQIRLPQLRPAGEEQGNDLRRFAHPNDVGINTSAVIQPWQPTSPHINKIQTYASIHVA